MCNCKKNKCNCEKQNHHDDDTLCRITNDLSKIKHKLCQIKNCLSCECSTPIFQKDLPLVITQPGCYCIAEDLVFTPKPSSQVPAPPNAGAVQAAITILASNVQLNFGCHTLEQFIPPAPNQSQQVPFVIGVLIPDPLPDDPKIDSVGQQSIYITGDTGIISNFSMYGIRIFAHVADIKLSGLTIKNTAALASLALRPTVYGFEYLPHSFDAVASFGPAFGVAAIAIGESTGNGMGPTFFTNVPQTLTNVVNRTFDVEIDNVRCINNFLTTIIATSITNFSINNSHFDDTYSDDPGRLSVPPAANDYTIPRLGAAIFADIANSVPNGNTNPSNLNMTVTNTTFNNVKLIGNFTTFANDLPRRFKVNSVLTARCKNVSWNNCEFNNLTNTFVSADYTIGYINFATENEVFNGCTFNNINSIGPVRAMDMVGNLVGPQTLISSRNIVIRNCSTANIVSDRSLQRPAPIIRAGQQSGAYGFAFFYVKNLLVENCVASDIIGNGPDSNGINNAGFVYAILLGVIIELGQSENGTFRNCTAQRVQSNNGGIVNGFYTSVSPLTTGHAGAVVFENCISTGNRAITSPFPQWNPALNYLVGSLVSFQGVNYRALVANIAIPPLGNPATWSTTTGVTQATAIGFTADDFGGPNIIAPQIYRNCTASRNRGALSIPSGYYSSGFFVGFTNHITIDTCIATENIRGIMLNQSGRCTVRNCQSDNNFENTTGEGYVDTGFIGTGDPSAPTVSNSTFENNRAYNNGNGITHDGPNGNYNIIYNLNPLVREALLAGQLAVTNSFAPTSSQPTYYANLHNISTIQNNTIISPREVLINDIDKVKRTKSTREE